MTDVELQVKKYLPEGWDESPTDVVGVLKAARDVLLEEDRWIRSSWFRNDHPEVDPEDPFCNDWAVCAEGAVAIVSLGTIRRRRPSWGLDEWSNWEFDQECSIPTDKQPPGGLLSAWRRNVYPEADKALYHGANRVLARTGRAITGTAYDNAFSYNDHHFTTRTEVVDWFNQAIEMAEAAVLA